MKRLLPLALLLVAACGERAESISVPLPKEFAVETLDGRRLTPAELKGQPLLLNYWSPD